MYYIIGELMLRRYIDTGIILLFLLSSIIPFVSSNEISTNNIIYVDDDGGADYTRIQDAIDNSSGGDTIFVFSGIYNERIKINKTITLTGENKDNTIIDGGGVGDVVYVSVDADWVNVSGFTIQCSGHWSSNAGIEIRSNFNSIKDNIITLHKFLSIKLMYSSNNTIEKNIISQNKRSGIYIYERCHNNTIKGNTIFDNYEGIVFTHGVTKNTSRNNIVFDNDISSNTRSGIFIASNAINTTIKNNNICENSYGIWTFSRYNLIIEDNTISSNNLGLWFWRCSNILVRNNKISSNRQEGILLEEVSKNNTIYGNNINSNGKDGIELRDYSNNNRIVGNTIISNGGYGIILDFSEEVDIENCTNNVIYHNNFIKNEKNAYDNDNNTWDNGEEGNYWADYKKSYPDAERIWFKGIWDTPYDISGGDNHDRFPLTKPYSKSKSYVNPSFLHFLENHPNMFPILRYLLDL